MSTMDLTAQIAFTLGFAILGLAVLTWIVVIVRDLPKADPELHGRISKITHPVFNAAPAQEDMKNSSFAVRLVVEGIIPIVFWILIIVPMVVFPIVLVLMALFHIPWSYLLPVPP